MKTKQAVAGLVSIAFGIGLSFSVWAENEEASTENVEEIIETHSEDDILIDKIYFPDLQFLSYIRTFDKNDDGYLSLIERNTVYTIEVYNYGINTLKGIEYFPELRTLKCSKNNFKELDVSKNTKLQVLTCSDNYVESLNLLQNTELTSITASDTTLKSIYLPKSIKNISLSGTKIDYLDLSSYPALGQLTLSNIAELKTLKLDNTSFEKLTCINSGLQSLDLSNNTSIRWVQIHNNKQLSNLTLGSDSRMEMLWCDGGALSSLDLSGCPNLNSVSINNQTRAIETVADINLEEFYISLGDEVNLAKISNVSIGRFDNSTGRIYFDGLPKVDAITYQYRVSSNRKMTVNVPLSIPYHELTVNIPGQESENIIVDVRNPILPNPPQKEDEVFEGWYFDAECTIPYVHEEILNNTELHAKYNKVYLLIYAVGKEQTIHKVIENQLLEQPADPIKDGYRFTGWYISGTNIKWDFLQDTVQDHLILQARFEKINKPIIDEEQESKPTPDINDSQQPDIKDNEQQTLIQTNDDTNVSLYAVCMISSLVMGFYIGLKQKQ